MPEQIYHQYKKWECFRNGMWNGHGLQQEKDLLNQVVAFTGNHINYGVAMMTVVKAWPVTMEHHLTDHGLNQRAFVGYTACSYKFNWPESLVRMAWAFLDDQQQLLANLQADKAIAAWNLNRGINHQSNQLKLF